MKIYVHKKKKKGRTVPGQKLITANRPRAKVNQCENQSRRTKFRANGPRFTWMSSCHETLDPVF